MMAFRHVWPLAAAISLAACGLLNQGRPKASYDEGTGADAAQGGDGGTAESEYDGIPRSLALMQGSEDGARSFLQHFLDPQADYVQLTSSMRPMTSDLEAIFDAQAAAKVESWLAKEWSTPQKLVIRPKKGQTEIKIWSATGTELAQGTGSAKDFPPEYRKIGERLAPDRLFFRFKFVEPGKDTTVAWDALTFVGDHWLLVPKPWRALGFKDDGSAVVPKPKGKGRK